MQWKYVGFLGGYLALHGFDALLDLLHAGQEDEYTARLFVALANDLLDNGCYELDDDQANRSIDDYANLPCSQFDPSQILLE